MIFIIKLIIMRRIDKIKNIQKVNMLTEQRQNAGRSIINESEESLPQFAGKLAQQHNIMLINQPMGKPELVKGFTDNKGIYPNNKDGVMAYQQSQNGGTISILSNNQDLNNAIFVMNV
jgi:hypothetical protein